MVPSRQLVAAIVATGLFSIFLVERWELHAAARSSPRGDKVPAWASSAAGYLGEVVGARNRSATGQALYVVHWIHIPKAAGTSMSQLARKIACKMNPDLKDVNPCCIPDLCAVRARCYSSAGNCPLVQGIGMHTNLVDRAAAVPCCADEWVRFAAPTSAALALAARNPADEPPELTRGFVAWPVEHRAAFFARLGVLTSADLSELPAVRRNESLYDRLVEIIDAEQRPLLADTMHRTKEEKNSAFAAEDRCLAARADVGSRSMTMLRHPVSRVVSAFFYRGHNPNFDVFNLRPGLWLMPFKRNSGIRLKEYFMLDEYSNVQVKMFGDMECKVPHGSQMDTGACVSVRGRARGECACSVIRPGCHAYHNASSYLSMVHVDAAARTLEAYAYFGFLEAYTASVLLVNRTFGVAVDDADLFGKQRGSETLVGRCSPSRAMRLDGDCCRAAFRANYLDAVLYEKAHRFFCGRLADHGLLDNADVQDDLARAKFCTDAHDFSDEDHVCGPLETPEGLENLHATRFVCRRATGPRWWVDRYGFHADTSDRAKRRQTTGGGGAPRSSAGPLLTR